MKSMYYYCLIICMLLLVTGCKPHFTQGYAEEHITQWENDSEPVELHHSYMTTPLDESFVLFRVEIPLGKWKVEIIW